LWNSPDLLYCSNFYQLGGSFSDQNSTKVRECFLLAEQLGVASYPSVVAVIEGKAKLISQGYVQISELEVLFDQYI